MRCLSALALLIAIGVTPALSQSTTTTPTPSPSDGNPAIKSPTPNSDKPSAAGGAGAGQTGSVKLEAGSNSFTEDQARSRLENAGFTNLTGLAKDEQGIWRAKAQRSGKAVSVGLDYKGNIGSE